MSANFTPDLITPKNIPPFRFWCQKVLPLVYDDSLSYYELLCKVVDYLNKTIADVATANTNVDLLLEAYNQLQEYVNNYFDSEEMREEIDRVVREIVEEELSVLTPAYILSNATNKKIIFIGDSYGTGEGSDDTYVSYIDRCANSLGLVINQTYWKNAVGGASFVGWDGRHTFLSLLQDISLTEDQKNLITDIVVAGGVNDAFNGQAVISQSLTAMYTFVGYCRTNYPNAKVHVCLIGWSKQALLSLYIEQKSAPVYLAAGYAGAGAVDMRYLNHIYTNFQSDGVHPNDTGHRTIGWGLASYLVNSNPCYKIQPITIDVALNSEIFDTSVNPRMIITEFMDEKTAGISVARFTLRLLSNVTMQQDVDITLGSFTGVNYINNITGYGKFPLSVRMIGTSGGQNVAVVVEGNFYLSQSGDTTTLIFRYHSPVVFDTVTIIQIIERFTPFIPVYTC